MQKAAELLAELSQYDHASCPSRRILILVGSHVVVTRIILFKTFNQQFTASPSAASALEASDNEVNHGSDHLSL